MTRRLNKMFLDAPLWRIEWRGADDCIEQVSIIEEAEYEEHYRHADIAAVIKEVGGATSVRMRKLNDFLDPIEEDDGP